MAGVDGLPRLVNFPLQCNDSLLIFLTQLESCLYLGRVGDDLRIELAALADEALLIVCAAPREARGDGGSGSGGSRHACPSVRAGMHALLA